LKSTSADSDALLAIPPGTASQGEATFRNSFSGMSLRTSFSGEAAGDESEMPLRTSLAGAEHPEGHDGHPAGDAAPAWTEEQVAAAARLAEGSVAVRCARLVWVPDTVVHADLAAVRRSWAELAAAGRLAEIASTDYYVFGPAVRLVAAARERGDMAVMPLGAGGPGANLFVVTSHEGGQAELSRFLAEHDVPRMDPDVVAAVVSGTGVMRGWMPLELGMEPWSCGVAVERGDASPEVEEAAAAAVLRGKSEPALPATFDNASGEVALLTAI
jgi:hypothetical protein